MLGGKLLDANLAGWWDPVHVGLREEEGASPQPTPSDRAHPKDEQHVHTCQLRYAMHRVGLGMTTLFYLTV